MADIQIMLCRFLVLQPGFIIFKNTSFTLGIGLLRKSLIDLFAIAHNKLLMLLTAAYTLLSVIEKNRFILNCSEDKHFCLSCVFIHKSSASYISMIDSFFCAIPQ